jgi:hypothetical protein
MRTGMRVAPSRSAILSPRCGAGPRTTDGCRATTRRPSDGAGMFETDARGLHLSSEVPPRCGTCEAKVPASCRACDAPIRGSSKQSGDGRLYAARLLRAVFKTVPIAEQQGRIFELMNLLDDES